MRPRGGLRSRAHLRQEPLPTAVSVLKQRAPLVTILGKPPRHGEEGPITRIFRGGRLASDLRGALNEDCRDCECAALSVAETSTYCFEEYARQTSERGRSSRK